MTEENTKSRQRYDSRRREQLKKVPVMEARIVELETKVAKLETEIAELKHKNTEMVNETKKLWAEKDKEIADLKAENAARFDAIEAKVKYQDGFPVEPAGEFK